MRKLATYLDKKEKFWGVTGQNIRRKEVKARLDNNKMGGCVRQGVQHVKNRHNE